MADDERLALADRIERIEAHNAITDLIHEYARLVRRDEPEKVSALFAPSCVFEIRDGDPDKPEFSVRHRTEGLPALHDYFLAIKGKPHPVPILHNIMIETDGDKATSNALMNGKVYGTEVQLFGEYRDTFSRVEGRWLFASRTFTNYRAESAV